MRFLLPIFLPVFLGCNEKQPEKYVSDVLAVRLEPSSASLVTRPGEPASQDFKALATFVSGDEKPIDLVSWSVSNASAGGIDDDGRFRSSDLNGGITTVTASHMGVSGSAEVTVVYTDDLVEKGVDEAVIQAFHDASAVEDSSLALLYPGDGTVVPRNLDGLGFVWELPEGHDITRIRMQTALSDISLYTGETSWYSNAELWSVITATNRQGLVSIHLESGRWDGAALSDVRSGPGIELTINRFDATGSVMYWSTLAGGVVRVPFASLEGSLYWGMTESKGRCTGCHIVSEPVQRMVLTNEGVGGTFTIVDLTEPEKPAIFVDADNERRLTWKTASPDGQWLLGTTTGVNPQPPWNPQPVLYSLLDGQKIKEFDLGPPVGQPDWSPDGGSVVMVRMTGIVNSEFQFNGGEIIQLDWQEDSLQLGAPQVLVPRDIDSRYNYFYPVYSPDGEWIVYCRSTGDSYSDPDAELWMISRDGSTNIRLDTVNGPKGTMSSTPRWGPLPDDDVLWLAFSSVRDYPLGSPVQPQIWVTAINPELAEKGEDPSHVPFWLPGQELSSNNHLPLWWSR